MLMRKTNEPISFDITDFHSACIWLAEQNRTNVLRGKTPILRPKLRIVRSRKRRRVADYEALCTATRALPRRDQEFCTRRKRVAIWPCASKVVQEGAPSDSH